MNTRWVCLPLVILVALSGTRAGATILTFDNMGLTNSGSILDYGSNVTGLCASSGQAGCFGQGNGFTPNINVSYRTITGTGDLVAAGMRFWDVNYGDLVNIAFMTATSNVGEITLSPQNGNLVRINSLDAAGWNQADKPNQSIRVLDAANTVLFSFTGTIHGVGPTHDHFVVDVSSAGPLRLQYSNDWNSGLDNINFDQLAVPATGAPEPSTFLLMFVGIAVAVFRLRCSTLFSANQLGHGHR